MMFARASLLSLTAFSSKLMKSSSSLISPSTRRFINVAAASLYTTNDPFLSPPPPARIEPVISNPERWKPMCLYHTHGMCTKMDDPAHLVTFNHDISKELQVNPSILGGVRPQNLDYLLVLDLEGKVEILEFPVVMIDTRTLQSVDLFHRFVRPDKMSEKRVGEYIEGKYGEIGVDRVWHDTAIPFKEVIQQFEIWMANHHLWEVEHGGFLRKAAFVTCGNWDLKTKVPQQCRDSNVKLPSYFMEWINLKDIYLNFYKRRATGMKTMMRELGIPLMGSHHLGIDDSKNIARVLQRMLIDGAVMQITARRRLVVQYLVVQENPNSSPSTYDIRKLISEGM